MPKIKGTNKLKKEMLLEKLNPEYIIKHTSIFSPQIGGGPLDEYTVKKIQESFKMWFDSWIKDDLEEVLKPKN